MAARVKRARVNLDEKSTRRRKRADFQAVPGEAEADVVRDAFLRSTGPNPANVASALSQADDATRARVVSRLQHEQGNQFVQRLVIQRSDGKPDQVRPSAGSIAGRAASAAAGGGAAGMAGASGLVPAVPADKLSGAHWVDKYPTSKTTDTLKDPFKTNVEAFIKMLQANGATVTIDATFRPPERAYLMHYAWKIARGQIKYGCYPTSDPYCIGIVWDHGSAEASRKAAQDMVRAYGMAHQAALKSRHTQGRAIDMTITGLPGTLTLPDESTVHIGDAKPEENEKLWALAKKHFSVHKLAKDPPHWSDDGH